MNNEIRVLEYDQSTQESREVILQHNISSLQRKNIVAVLSGRLCACTWCTKLKDRIQSRTGQRIVEIKE